MYTFVAVDTSEGRCAWNPDKTSDPVELQAQAVVRHPKGLRETNWGPLGERCALLARDLSGPYKDFLLTFFFFFLVTMKHGFCSK